MRRALFTFVYEHRADLIQALVWVAVLCMVLSSYFFRPQPESLARYRPTPGPKDFYDPRAPWYFVAGALALAGALMLVQQVVPTPARTGGRLSPLSPLRAWVLVVPGVLLLLAAAEINGEMVGQFDWLWKASPQVQFALLVAGTILSVGGLAGVPRLSYPSLNPSPQAERDSELPFLRVRGKGPGDRGKSRAHLHPYVPSGEAGLVVLLTVIALGVRFYRIDTSVRMMIDEIHFALGAAYFWTFPDVNLLEPMPTSASFPFIYSYGIYEMVQLLGRTFLGLRALSAILGALTIPATYGLARELFDRRTALMAALILLTFPPHVHYSRLALNNIADPLFGTLALYFLARTLRTHHRRDYVLAGVMLGAAQYFYEGGRILFPLLAAGWMGIGVVLWRPRPSLRGLILAVLAFVVIAMPVYYTLVGVDFPLFDRTDKAELDERYWERQRETNNWQARFERFEHSLLHYVNSPENTLFHFYLYYGGRHPLLLVYVIPPFFLGAVIAAVQWRRPGAVLVLWLLLTSMGNALLLESAVSARYVLAFPAVAILVALGIRVPLEMLWRDERFGSGQAALMIALAVGIAAGQAVYYFGPHLEHFNAELRQQVAHDVEDALLRSVDFPPGTEIWLIGDGSMMGQADAQRVANFFADDLVIVVAAPLNVTVLELAALPRDRDLAFFFDLDDRATLVKLTEVFAPRKLRVTPYDDMPPDKAFVLFYVPADVRAPGEFGTVG